MKKVININFQGRVIPIEETAYDMLKQYVDSLRRFFATEEGKDEIINDIEGRIAELFGESLKKGSTCITDEEVTNVINSMGRPEDFEAEENNIVVVDKSTVPVGTADKVSHAIAEALRERGVSHEFAVVSNPEFLKEGAAVADFMRPDRIVLGLPDGPLGARAREIMDRLYAPLQRNHQRTIYMDVRSAELTKYAANAMLATRISFMNELANLASAVGADIESVRQGIGSDSRIGYHFLYAGTGYGGSCFPKDIRAISHTGREHGMELNVVHAVEQVNEQQKEVLVRMIQRRFGADLRGRTFGLWGLAFKPNTDDMRDAPSRVIIGKLVDAGARIVAYDPVAMKEAKRALALDLGDSSERLGRVSFADAPEDCIEGADALVIATEWKIFKSPDWALVRKRLKQPVVFDGRNLFSPQLMSSEGFEYHSIGRAARKY